MGVGNERKDVFFTPYIQENDMQHLESASGQSTDEEDVVHQPASTSRSHRNRSRPRSASLEACLTGMYRRCGVRQARRTENIKSLLSLGLDGEEDTETQTPTYNSNSAGTPHGLPQLFQERSKMQIWNDFVNSSEEDQERILHMRRSGACLCSIQEASDEEDSSGSLDNSWEKVAAPPRPDNAASLHADKRAVHPSYSAQECFQRLDKHIRFTLTRRQLPLGMLAQLEREVVEFFQDCPTSVFLSHVTSSYERLLLHGVCQYLGLQCRSYEENGQRRTQVENKMATFQRPQTSLTDYLQQVS